MVSPVMHNGQEIWRHIFKGPSGVPFIKYNHKKYAVVFHEERSAYTKDGKHLVRVFNAYKTTREIKAKEVG